MAASSISDDLRFMTFAHKLARRFPWIIGFSKLSDGREECYKMPAKPSSRRIRPLPNQMCQTAPSDPGQLRRIIMGRSCDNPVIGSVGLEDCSHKRGARMPWHLDLAPHWFQPSAKLRYRKVFTAWRVDLAIPTNSPRRHRTFMPAPIHARRVCHLLELIPLLDHSRITPSPLQPKRFRTSPTAIALSSRWQRDW